MTDIEKIKEQLAELQKKVEEFEEEQAQVSGRWKPKKNETYFSIDQWGCIDDISWAENRLDEEMWAVGNVFRTREEAEFTVEKLKVWAELKENARPFKTDEENYFIILNTKINQLAYVYGKEIQCPQLYFESEERAKEAVKAVGEARVKKYYLEVDID